jgi:hypothetical protein
MHIDHKVHSGLHWTNLFYTFGHSKCRPKGRYLRMRLGLSFQMPNFSKNVSKDIGYHIINVSLLELNVQLHSV